MTNTQTVIAVLLGLGFIWGIRKTISPLPAMDQAIVFFAVTALIALTAVIGGASAS